ncbi:hypothetical protein LX32DRAFT_647748 [Colletotrichum zoysiae]|uniref:Uncharacterized protein n=1 Tax=Colletotrichum zoysiae TaxID=1216348 RepID=A0AAD9HWE8_9PEZI|nr:hypothetical protein LX32DRAFT_647748 [Colletotrichum zoysiae]
MSYELTKYEHTTLAESTENVIVDQDDEDISELGVDYQGPWWSRRINRKESTFQQPKDRKLLMQGVMPLFKISWFDGYYYFISKKCTNVRLTHAANVTGTATVTGCMHFSWFVYSCMTSATHRYTSVRQLDDDYALASPKIAIISPPEHQCEQGEIQVQKSPSDLSFRV